MVGRAATLARLEDLQRRDARPRPRREPAAGRGSRRSSPRRCRRSGRARASRPSGEFRCGRGHPSGGRVTCRSARTRGRCRARNRRACPSSRARVRPCRNRLRKPGPAVRLAPEDRATRSGAPLTSRTRSPRPFHAHRPCHGPGPNAHGKPAGATARWWRGPQWAPGLEAGTGLGDWSVGAVPAAPWPEGWPPSEPGCDAEGATTRCDPASPKATGSAAGAPDRVGRAATVAGWTATPPVLAMIGRAATVPS